MGERVAERRVAGERQPTHRWAAQEQRQQVTARRLDRRRGRCGVRRALLRLHLPAGDRDDMCRTVRRDQKPRPRGGRGYAGATGLWCLRRGGLAATTASGGASLSLARAVTHPVVSAMIIGNAVIFVGSLVTRA
jgi:hypothetical protein